MRSLVAYYVATVLIVVSALIHIGLWSSTPAAPSALDEQVLTLHYLLGFSMGQCRAMCILHANDVDACAAQFPHRVIPPIPSADAMRPYDEACGKYMRPVLPEH